MLPLSAHNLQVTLSKDISYWRPDDFGILTQKKKKKFLSMDDK